MPKLATAVVVSLLANGAAVAWVRLPAARPQLVRALTHEPVAQPAEPEPVAIELLDDHTVPSLPATAVLSQGGPAVGGHHAQITTGRAHSTETAKPPEKHSALMTMRKPELVGPSDDFWAKFEANTRPLQPRDIPSEQNAVELENDTARLHDPHWVASASSDELMAARAKLVGDLEARDADPLKPAGGGRYKSEQAGTDMLGNPRTLFTVDTAPDGNVKIHDSKNFKASGLTGSFDVTDWAMRDHGNDPYSSAKLKWLDDTRDERVAIGTKYRKDVLAHTPAYVQNNLARLWQTVTDPRQRKRALFELWDECAETGNDDAIAAGNTARTLVVGFIRANLPADAVDAYTSDELAQLNAHRLSRLTFAPYD